MGSKIIELEEGWSYMLAGVTKLKKILEGEPEPEFDSGYYMSLYTTIFTMCRQDPPHNYSQQLYDRYGEIYEDYYMQTVLPSLRIKHGEYMLKELAHRWSNHKIMVRWLTRFFYYLDRYFIKKRSLPTLNEVGLRCFRDLVYHEMRSKAKDVVLALIYREREGEQIDRELLKNVLDVYVENGMGKYEEDFEIFMLQDTASYYSSKASSWIQDDSCPEYMLKSEECLKKERDRVIHYLHSTTEPKLVKKVQNELLVVFAKQLLENEHSGFLALIRDDKMDDLSRMYKLYHSIPKGLELVADLFNKHVTAEGNILIKQTEDAATNQAAIVTELGDKYMVYVTECFQNHIIFHKALQAAFEFLGNKKVAASSSREELLATFCDNDNLLKKGGETKHGDGEEFGDEGYI